MAFYGLMKGMHCGQGKILRLDIVLVLEVAKSDSLREMLACSFCSCPRQGLRHLTTEAAPLTHSFWEYRRMSSEIPLSEKKPPHCLAKCLGSILSRAISQQQNKHYAGWNWKKQKRLGEKDNS